MNLKFKTTQKQNQQFEEFFKLLVETNKLFNLTAIIKENEVAEKHFFDSVQAAGEIEEGAAVVDVGAGAGFPSVPLKIMRSDLKLTLVDSLNKRVNFLNDVGVKLCFNNYECVHARAEDFAKNRRECFNVGVARAVAPLPTLCELVAPLVKVGGKLILFKGSGFEEEIKASENAFKVLGLAVKKIVPYCLEEAGQNRVLIVLSKTKKTPPEYPRPQNKPKLSPL